MKHEKVHLENLTRSSLRLNKGVLVLLAVVSLLIGTSYWSLQRVISEQEDTVRFHFARLMESIREQESFLVTLSRGSRQGEMLKDDEAVARVRKPLPEEGPYIYQGKEFEFSMPFSVKFDPERLDDKQQARLFSLGVHLANFYGTFWSTSHNQSPQAFLFDHHADFDITVPGAGHSRSKTLAPNESFVDVIRAVQSHLPKPGRNITQDSVTWVRYQQAGDRRAPERLMAYISIAPDPAQSYTANLHSPLLVAILMDLAQVNDIERTMNVSIFDDLILVAPSGEVLIGTMKPHETLHEGLNIGTDGLVFKIVGSDEPRWTAIYTIDYHNFFNNVGGPLSYPALLTIALLLTGWGTNRWYKTRVILPARQAHESIAESEAFNRAVIDTAPTGLCVVRRSDQSILRENQLARQWQGTAKVVEALERREERAGESYLEIDGRHLQVGFVSTRYQGQDVRLYAFNDVTRHIEDAAALEEARRAADAANEAKTLFLATMTHEIRTPLYGVLGTLELLSLTPLEPRQQGYLQTIQRSSATLFQLISDVLDVSKIESGQMAIDSTAFMPLELIEDTLRTYAAFAQRKGLQLYACTDHTLPNRLMGDPLRIRQILNNLLSNAIKFTDTGRVVLRTRVLEQSGNEVHLEWQVADTGIGISTAQQAKLFELFYQVREATSEGGAGLGLPICWLLSEMMGGEMKVISEPGLGSSFSLRLRLPALPSELPDEKMLEPTTSPVHVVSSAQDLATSVSNWLSRMGFYSSVAPLAMNSQCLHAVRVELQCPDSLPDWAGPQIKCTSGGPTSPEQIDGVWHVDMHDIHAIGLAVSLAQKGKLAVCPPMPSQQHSILGLRILVAEDNPINQAIITEQLEALGCTVVVASNGEQALDLWRVDAFDLVLTDVNMPVMNGYELAKALRESAARLPIIGVTANAMREEGLRCLEVGMNAWIVKPLSLKMLREQLVKLCPPTDHILRPDHDANGPRHNSGNTNNGNGVRVSVAMRPLFISTMRQDIQRIEAALLESNPENLIERLHSLAGALGAVQATDIAQKCIAIELQLSEGLTPSLEQQTRGVLDMLSAIIASLE